MQTRQSLRSVGALALAAVAAGVSAVAAPANAAADPTATLTSGVVTVTGTANRDVIAIKLEATQLTVDFGADGTIDARFARSQFRSLRVLGGDGDDGVSVVGGGVGDLPITMRGQLGNDFLGVVGNIGDLGDGDQRITMVGDNGNDTFLAATPGPVTVLAGAGNDRVDGGGAGTGQETVSLGDGDDRFVSSLNRFVAGGSRSDVVDGGAGRDALDVQGSFAAEGLALSANAGHLIVDHDMRDRIDADNVEDVSWRGFGGLDGGTLSLSTTSPGLRSSASRRTLPIRWTAPGPTTARTHSPYEGRRASTTSR